MGCIPARARFRLGAKDIQPGTSLGSPAFYCDLWRCTTCPARDDHPPDKVDLDDPGVPARVGLECDSPAADPVIRGCSRRNLPKAAQSPLMVVTPGLALGSARRAAGWRGPLG